MAFESLSDKLQNVFKNLRGKGRLSEADVKAALKEVKMALLEADVSFKVVKQFIGSVQERAVGQDVLNSLTPGQMVVKIVHEELINLMGSETTEIALKPSNEITVIMMAGLQGAGKTTTTAKIAGKLKSRGRKPLLAACDVYRPAAIEQLKIFTDDGYPTSFYFTPPSGESWREKMELVRARFYASGVTAVSSDLCHYDIVKAAFSNVPWLFWDLKSYNRRNILTFIAGHIRRLLLFNEPNVRVLLVGEQKILR